MGLLNFLNGKTRQFVQPFSHHFSFPTELQTFFLSTDIVMFLASMVKAGRYQMSETMTLDRFDITALLLLLDNCV